MADFHEKLMEDWREAYAIANEKPPPEIQYSGKGWFKIPGLFQGIRTSELRQMIERLQDHAQANGE